MVCVGQNSVAVFFGAIFTKGTLFFSLGRRTLLLPWADSRNQWLTCRPVNLQRATVSQGSGEGGGRWVRGFVGRTCLLANAFRLILTFHWRSSIFFSVLSVSLSFSVALSGMFDDGVYVYLIEPLKQTHSIVSGQWCSRCSSALFLLFYHFYFWTTHPYLKRMLFYKHYSCPLQVYLCESILLLARHAQQNKHTGVALTIWSKFQKS